MPDPWASLAPENIHFSSLRAKFRICQMETWPPCWSRRCLETWNYYIFKTFIFHVFFHLFLKALKCQIRGLPWRRKIFTSAYYEQNSGFAKWKGGRRAGQGDASRLEITIFKKKSFFTFYFNYFLKWLKCQIRGLPWRRKIFASALYEQNSRFDKRKTGRRACQGEASRLEITIFKKKSFFTFFSIIS